MGEAKHTSGPWTVAHFANPDVNCVCGYVLCDSKMGAVAKVYWSDPKADWKESGDNPSPIECVANAHLIAAAPDLLHALKTAISIIGHPDDVMTQHFESVVAKAEGRDTAYNARTKEDANARD